MVKDTTVSQKAYVLGIQRNKMLKPPKWLLEYMFVQTVMGSEKIMT